MKFATLELFYELSCRKPRCLNGVGMDADRYIKVEIHHIKDEGYANKKVLPCWLWNRA